MNLNSDSFFYSLQLSNNSKLSKVCSQTLKQRDSYGQCQIFLKVFIC